MAGHSKWANIKRHKGAQDAKRGQAFTKLIKEITVAARLGGSDAATNPRLRVAIEKAKAQSMPKDNIERAVKKGSGELGGAALEEIMYEGYGPSGVALIIEAATDNKNRTASEIRLAFSKNAGNLAESGSVAWMFQKKGVFYVSQTQTTEENLIEKALEAGADDIESDADTFRVTTTFEMYPKVLDVLVKNNIKPEENQVEWLAQNKVKITDLEIAKRLLTLVETLEANDDVQNVWANFEWDEAIEAAL